MPSLANTSLGRWLGFRLFLDDSFLDAFLGDPRFRSFFRSNEALRNRWVEIAVDPDAGLLERPEFASRLMKAAVDQKTFLSHPSLWDQLQQARPECLVELLGAVWPSKDPADSETNESSKNSSLSIAKGVFGEILQDARLWESVDSPAAILSVALGSPRIRSTLARDRAMLARLFDDDDFFQGVVYDSRILSKILWSQPALDGVSGDSALSTRMLQDPTIRSRVASDNGLLSSLFHGDETLDGLLAAPGFLSRILHRPQVRDAILADEALLDHILHRGKSFERILADEALLSRLLDSGKVRERLMADEALLDHILHRGKSFERILADEALLMRLLHQGKVRERLIADEGLLGALLNQGRTFERILADEALLDRLFREARFRDRTVANDEFLEKILADKRTASAAYGDETFCSRLFDHPRALKAVVSSPMLKLQREIYQNLREIMEFDTLLGRLHRHLDTEAEDWKERALASRRQVAEGTAPQEALLDLIAPEGTLRLSKGVLRCPDRHSLWITVQEILIHEEYFFETDEPSPRILDCGAHFGLATYYFKSLYPNARITAFEPVQEIWDLLQTNVRENGFREVETVRAALAASEGEVEFQVSLSDSMAGSIHGHRRRQGDEIRTVSVPCLQLSKFLDEPVHFLKIDIEGAEDQVLGEIAPKLGAVQHLFVEYHEGEGLAGNRLPKILGQLDSAGFHVQVSKSSGSWQHTHRKPMAFVHEPYSATIWGKNSNWR